MSNFKFDLKSNAALFVGHQNRAVNSSNIILKRIAELNAKPAKTIQDVGEIHGIAHHLNAIERIIQKGYDSEDLREHRREEARAGAI